MKKVLSYSIIFLFSLILVPILLFPTIMILVDNWIDWIDKEIKSRNL